MGKRSRAPYDVSTADGQRRLMAESMGLPRETYIPRPIAARGAGDYGTDPAENGMVRMVPSGDIVTPEEARRRLGR